MKEINTEEFTYFISNPMLVVGVFEETLDHVEYVVLKGCEGMFERGMAGQLDKDSLQAQVEAGISVLHDSYEEAMACDISLDVPEDVWNFIADKK